MTNHVRPMAPHPLTRDVLRNRTMSDLSEGEREMLEKSISETRAHSAGHIAVRAGANVNESILLLSGMMSRHVDAADGRRHMVGIHVPGDFVDLHAYALKKLDHDVGALTDVTVAILPHATLERIQAEHAHLTKRLWFLTLLDAALHRQWTFRLASLNAAERAAHFLCEMNARLLAIGASDGRAFELPMTQADIGEVCAITNVHMSRALKQLREGGLCTVRASHVEISDLRGLAALGKFQPDYIYLNAETAQKAAGH